MNFDIDIDFPTNFNPLEHFPNWTRASVLKNEKLTPHPCGIYPQSIGIDPITGLAAIPYEQAEELGYFKLDMLHLAVYNNFTSREEILQLLEIDPNWDLLLDIEIVPKLFQLSKHLDLLRKIKPTSIEEVADVLALIRPGKSSLLGLYQKDQISARKLLYLTDEDGSYSFKRSHSISYAMVIVLQLHLVEVGLL